MNEDNGSLASKKRIIMLVAAVVLLLAGLFVLFRNVFIKNSADDNEIYDNSSGAAVPEISAPQGFDDVFYDVDQNDPLKYLAEPSNLSATVTVTDSYNTYSSTSYSVIKFGEKFRIENGSTVVIYDGERLYKSTPSYTITEELENYDLFTELGISTLDKIKNQITSDDSAQVGNDGTNFTAEFFDENDQLARKCVISAESGIVISETAYYEGNTRRETAVGSIKILTESDIASDMFTLPE